MSRPATSPPRSLSIIDTAASLLDGSDLTEVHPEYLRALVELSTYALGLTSDGFRDDVQREILSRVQH